MVDRPVSQNGRESSHDRRDLSLLRYDRTLRRAAQEQIFRVI